MFAKSQSYLFLISALFLGSFVMGCKTTKTGSQNSGNSSQLLISMQRTGCFGKCPIYQVDIYKDGSIHYNAVKFLDTTGKFCGTLTKSQLATINRAIKQASLLSLKDQYPDNKRPPADLPSCIINYQQGDKKKKIVDHGIESPEVLVALEKQIDNTVESLKLQTCDK